MGAFVLDDWAACVLPVLAQVCRMLRRRTAILRRCYDGRMSVFDAMRRYVDSADRTSPLVFVGRQRELERLDATIRNVTECGTEGATSVVYGVPGAGKTALARELANRWAQREADGRPVRVVRLGVKKTLMKTAIAEGHRQDDRAETPSCRVFPRRGWPQGASPSCAKPTTFVRSATRILRCCFPSATGKVISDGTVGKLLREQGVDATAHGFRSTFRDWAAEQRTRHTR